MTEIFCPKDQIPVLIFHIGDQEYFKNCVKITSKKNKIFLIGDDLNMNLFHDNKNVMFIHKNELETQEIKDFKDCFVNYSTNSYDYELNCFLRVFYMKSFFNKYNYKKIFHTDSDCVLFDDVNTIFSLNDDKIAYSIIKSDNEFHMAHSIHNALLNLDFCNKFVDLCFDIYKYRKKFHLIQSKIEWHLIHNHGGGICDMTLYYFIENNKIIENILNLNDIIHVNNEKIVFDHVYSSSYGFDGDYTYIMNYGHKYSIMDDQKEKIYFVSKDNCLLRAFSIHFQGCSKNLIQNFV